MYGYIAAFFVMLCLLGLVILDRNWDFVLKAIMSGIDTVKGWMYG